MTTMSKGSCGSCGCRCGGCGCGGKSNGGCRCGGKSGATATGTALAATSCSPCDDGAFLRPQFFAGQLLTEDDLDAIETYVVGKNRLHNARLFGAGVVCGLEVTCGPCDTMTIDVAPGYALDCCGNDLVLSCDRTIDLRPLVVALRSQTTGASDCGDPCAPANVGSTTTLKGATSTASPRGGTSTTSPTFEYCLYARYTETPTDPTTAYPTGGDCTTVTCQPTRVREGVTFELRCPASSTPDDVVTRLTACLGRLSSPDRQVGNSRALERASAQMRRALPRIARGIRELTEAEKAQWTAAQPELQHIAELQATRHVPTAREAVRWAELLVDIHGLYVRQHPPQKSSKVATPAAPAAPTGLGPEQVFAYIAKQLANPAVTDTIPQQLDKAYAIAVGQAFPAPTTRQFELAVDKPLSFPMQLLLYGAILTPGLQSAYVVAAQDLRAQLINAVSCSGGTTADCTLFDDLRMLSLPPPPVSAQDADLGAATDLMHYGSKLGGLVKRFFADCICRALNPPCPPCDDPGVLLACIKVRDCHVIEVCNMARTFVWSPAAMRYWLPPLTWLGDLLAKLCCTGPCGDDGQRAGFQSDPQAQFVMEMITRPSPESLALALPAFYGSGAYLPTLTSAGRELVDLAARRILPSNLGTAAAPAPDFAAIERRLHHVEQQLAARKKS